MKNPYKYPLRSRKDIVAELVSNGGYSSWHKGTYPLAFPVKANYVNFDWETVWDKYHAEYLPEGAQADESVLYAFKMVSYLLWEKNRRYLWDWGVEGAQLGVFEDEGNKTLWEGKTFDVQWAFTGASGGHLCPAEWNGYELEGIDEEEFEHFLMEMGWQDLYDLYRLYVQWDKDFTPKHASAEVEYQGVFNLYANIIEPEWERPIPVSMSNRRVLRLRK